MWPINPARDMSRGGFQNSDVGKTAFDNNYGPEYGVDYARFTDLPDVKKDLLLKRVVEQHLAKFDFYQNREVVVRNGFVILKGNVLAENLLSEMIEVLRDIPGVTEIINDVTFFDHH